MDKLQMGLFVAVMLLFNIEWLIVIVALLIRSDNVKD